jgi:peptidyl-prolyl cis-trans isomerase B (cyclophilin B)
MARTMQPHSATAQFFINVSDNRFLDYPGQDGWGYCVFGRVVEGMDVVDRIRKVTTSTQQGYQDVPVEPVIIEKAVISES